MARTDLPVLYSTGSNGKTLILKISVEDFGKKGALILMEHGGEGEKMSINRHEVTKGKNIGKTNETTPMEQALSEARSRWQKKKDKGYTETKKAQKTQKILLPMLAQKYAERKKYMIFPCYVQPKLDGVRCGATPEEEPANDVTYMSRGGKEFTVLSHLTKEILDLTEKSAPCIHLDGEIYNHNEITFQDICSAVKKTNEYTPLLQYYIYDIADDTLTFEQRKQMIEKMFKGKKFEHLVMVPTYEVKNEEEINKYHEQFVQDGYEGIIIRNKHGLYTFKHRSNDLQKLKNFVDKEFKIVGGKEATGDDKGTIVFICDVGDGRTFDVRPRGSRKLRSEWWKNLESLKGKQLTVRYQRLSDEGIPTILTGIGVRDYE